MSDEITAETLEKLKNSMMNGVKKRDNSGHNQNRRGNQRGNSQGKNNQNYRNGQNNYNKNYKQGTELYVGAPYNFISFTDNVYEYPEEKKVKHNDVSEELLTGEIAYEMIAQTPIIVDDGTNHFHRNPNGQYSIPGSTMRGLIRNNVQILGLSSFFEDIDDYALMYRNVAGGAEKKRYNMILGTDSRDDEMRGIAKNVKAGYLVQKSGKYYIAEIDEKYDKDMNYLMLSSKLILSNNKDYPFFIDDWQHNMMYTKDCILVRKEQISGKNEYNKNVKFVYETEDSEEVEACLVDGKFSYEEKNSSKTKIFISKMGKPGVYSKEGTASFFNKKIDRMISYEPKYKSMINKEYEPYYKPVYYMVGNNRKKVTKVKERSADMIENNMKRGYVLSSGWMNNKKNVYVIPDIDMEKANLIEISQKDILSFKTDLQKRTNTLKGYFHGDKKEKEKAIKKFYGLPEKEGETKPVFYIHLDGRLYFGFTPRLRLFYDHKIKHGLNKKHKEGIVDYSKAIFGYTIENKEKNKKENYRSKVSFTDAVVEDVSTFEMQEAAYILAEPKPSSYLDYLQQADKAEIHTYNNAEMKIRGVKQYWLHKEVVPQEPNDPSKDAVMSKFYPLDKGTKFNGKIRFRNLTKEELGLLLWSVRLEENSWMNVGKAKAYGYGNVKMVIKEVKCLDKKNAYQTDFLSLDPFKTVEIEPMIQVYKEEINKFLGKKSIDQLSNIQDFFYMKDHTMMPDEKEIRYMQIKNSDGKNEYQNRKSPLPRISSYKSKKQ